MTTHDFEIIQAEEEGAVSRFNTSLAEEARLLRFDIDALLRFGEKGEAALRGICAQRGIEAVNGTLVEAAVDAFLRTTKYRTRNKFRAAITQQIGQLRNERN